MISSSPVPILLYPMEEKNEKSILSSQSQYDATPVEHEFVHSSHFEASPMRKRGKRSSLTNNDEATAPAPRGSLFNFGNSQDSMMFLSSDSQQSTTSQDVVNRLGQLTCQNSQEYSNIENTDSKSSSYFTDIFSMPSLTSKGPNYHQGPSSRNHLPPSDPVDEKKITVSPSVVNPFLTELVGSKVSHKSKRPTTIWLQPYRERPRYIMDFEEEGVMGEGQFSVVYRARKRLDGTLYAVKKLKTRIHSEGEGVVLLREVCALAALKGCPNLMQYFGSWIEDSHLWIQCELCLRVNLDVFITFPDHSTPSGHMVPTFFKPRQSSTPRSCLGSDDSGALWNQEDELYVDAGDRGGDSGPPHQEGYPMSRHHNSFGSQSSSGFQMEDDNSNDDEEDDSQPWLAFPPAAFWTVLLGVSRALAFMHNKGIFIKSCRFSSNNLCVLIR